MLREKTIHFFIVEDEEQDEIKYEWWDVESLLT